MKNGRNCLLSIPVEPEIKNLLEHACRNTKLRQSDVIRSALRLGLAELVNRLEGVRRPRRNFAEYLGRCAGVVSRNREPVKPSRVK